MRISKLAVENFKKFGERFDFDLSEQNFLVGENNTGKTSVIDAINYLFSGPERDKNYKNLNTGLADHILVEAVICGDFSGVDKKYQDYIFKDEEGLAYMRVRRSDKEEIIDQAGKEVVLNESKIQCWSSVRKQFENPSGKDTTFNVLEVVSIYANDHVDNVVSFDSTKILGKLIKGSVGDFFETPEYLGFKTQHDAVFNSGPNSLKSRLNVLAEDISQILKDQWGEIELGFKFDLTDNSNHLKKGNVLVKEKEEPEGDGHKLEDKGSGLQRSVMLSMIQALSKIYSSDTDSNIVLCIDEPELNLHPRAQERLAGALARLSKSIQVVVSTHSPFMLKSFKGDSDTAYVFEVGKNAAVTLLERLSILPFGPTMAEIQYFAYKLTPNDLHNELYGYLEAEKRLGSFANTKRWLDERDLKKFAIDNTLDVDAVSDVQKESLKRDVSLQTYIRHSIHHPENAHNVPVSDTEISQSIQEMIIEVGKHAL